MTLLLRLASCCFLLFVGPAVAEPQALVKIVGPGATTCGEFVQQAKSDPPSQRLYLAWLQGYLSGLVIGRPAGVDEGIDLNPKEFPLRQQLAFIRDFCLSSPNAAFADAVEALFGKLKTIGKM